MFIDADAITTRYNLAKRQIGGMLFSGSPFKLDSIEASLNDVPVLFDALAESEREREEVQRALAMLADAHSAGDFCKKILGVTADGLHAYKHSLSVSNAE